MKRKIKAVISYDGHDFCGWQIQPNLRTVQGEITKCIKQKFGQDVDVVASGRTDAGVSALGQVVHFELDTDIDLSKISNILNETLPDDVKVLSSETAEDDFHARFSAKEKTYKYRFYVSKSKVPYFDRFACQVKYDLDIEDMKDAMTSFLGVHDFSAFCASDTSVQDKTREITCVDLTFADGVYSFSVAGKGFLYNMVRIMVGTLFDIGRGKISKGDILKILKSKDRKNAGATAPAHGLVLWQVQYD